ncbi:MAG: AAA family ATPase [Nocardioides sp.]
MIEELRIASLGVIESSTLELGPGLTVLTGETGAGKTMVVTALALLLGARADSGQVRAGARAARVEGIVLSDSLPEFASAVDAAGGTLEDDRVVLGRSISAEGRSRAFVGGASVPVATLADVAEPLVAVHGQSDQQGLLKASAQREALDRYAGSTAADLLAEWGRDHAALAAVEAELTAVTASARERAREADLLRFGLGEIEAIDPQPGEDLGLAAEEARLGFADTLRTAAEQAREALSSEEAPPTPSGPPPRPGPSSRECATTTPRPRSWPTGWPRRPTCSPTWPPTSPPTPPGWRATPPGSPRSRSGEPRSPVCCASTATRWTTS